MIFSLSVALAYILTNIDGLFFFLALSFTRKQTTAVVAFLAAQCAVTGGAAMVGSAASSLSPQWVGMLGLVPVTLGIIEVRRAMRREAGAAELRQSKSLAGAISVFLAMSTDTFVVTAAFFADTSVSHIHWVYQGVALAVAVLLAAGVLLPRYIRPSQRIQTALERLAPLVMIIAGIYVLMDTATDVM